MNKVPSRVIINGMFGQPVLRHAKNGRSGWVKDTGNELGLNQKSASGYLANLYGGVQTGDDWAAVYIPTNELRLDEFTAAMWSYYLTGAETFGLNMVAWVHDPNNFNRRAEITQRGNVSGLGKTAGYNAHKLDLTTDQFFYFGENWSTGSAVALSGSDLTSASTSLYGWDDFTADALFSQWHIYRVSFERGFEASGTFNDAWVADIKLNGQMIWLSPGPGEIIGRETKQFYKATVTDSTTKVTLVTPASTKRIEIISIFFSTASATVSTFELYFGTGANITSDTTKGIALVSLDTDTVPSIAIPFGEHGPKGDIDEVVSMRTGTNITSNGTFVIVYREV